MHAESRDAGEPSGGPIGLFFGALGAPGCGRPADLRNAAIPSGLRLAVTAPHPDDFDAVAVTLRHFHRAGARIAVAVLSGGASGVEDVFVSPPTAAAKAAAREAEQRASCGLFGLDPAAVTFLRLDEDAGGEPADTTANQMRLSQWLAAADPHAVFLPHGNDAKPGHRQVAALVARIAAGWPHPLFLMMNRDPKTLAMRHDAMMPYGAEAAAWKATLLRCHDSQQQRNLRTRGRGFDERILDADRATARDLDVGAEFAEAFEVVSCGRVRG